jgi:DNA-binding IclR family transcriptional regulator
MTELSESTGDNSVLASESGGRLITIANVEGSGDFVVSNQHLYFDHLYCTAVGKLLMAYSPPEFIEQFKKTRQLDRITPTTIVDWPSLQEEFKKIRSSGFSLNRGESLSMVAAIAVPVFDIDGSLLCALGQPFPDYFIETKRVDVAERTARLVECSAAISKEYAEAMRMPKGDGSC